MEGGEGVGVLGKHGGRYKRWIGRVCGGEGVSRWARIEGERGAEGEKGRKPERSAGGKTGGGWRMWMGVLWTYLGCPGSDLGSR